MSDPLRVLVDSSIWIDFYRPDGLGNVRAAVTEALAEDAVYTVPLIVAEVVQGAPDEATLKSLLEDFSAFRTVACDHGTGARAARIGYALRREGNPAPATDLLIAAATLEADCELWHRDRHFETIARVTPLRTRAFGDDPLRGKMI